MDRSCETCSSPLYAKNSRDMSRKRFCSLSCMGQKSALSIDNKIVSMRALKCARCGGAFQGRGARVKYCGKRCQGAAATMLFAKRKETMEGHISKLRHRPGRLALTQEFLVGLYIYQDGKCALSGVPMTWVVGKGHTATNISIDRIVPKGKYEPGNVRLVCHVVNLMRRDMADEDFLDWCETLVNLRNMTERAA